MAQNAADAREPHRHRRIAESFGTDPHRYDRTRAPYPATMIGRILTVSPGRDVLDVGCGTGIAARQFRDAGAVVLGVEPDARMAGFAQRTGIGTEIATFEDWDPAGRRFDAVVAGTAWHWVDPVAGAARAAQVLRPGGVLAPFGSVYELPPAVAAALAAALRRAAPDSPLGFDGRSGTSIRDAYRGLYDKAAAGVRAVGGFAEPEIRRYDWDRTCTSDALVELVATSGGLTSLPPDRAGEVLAAVGEAVDSATTATLPYTTWCLTAIRLR